MAKVKYQWYSTNMLTGAESRHDESPSTNFTPWASDFTMISCNYAHFSHGKKTGLKWIRVVRIKLQENEMHD